MFKLETDFIAGTAASSCLFSVWKRRQQNNNLGGLKMAKKQKCEVYSRVVGYLSPVSEWNKGKKEEFKDRKTFKYDEK